MDSLNKTSFGYLVNGLAETAEAVYHTIVSIININYDVVTLVVSYSLWFFEILSNFLANVFNFFWQFLSSFFDFVTECVRFLNGFVCLLWKFLVLLVNVLDILFRGIEHMFYFMITGGKWTADALKDSFINLSKTASSVSESIVTNVEYFAQMSSGAIVLIGTLSYKFIAILLNCIKVSLLTSWHVIDTIMIGTVDGIRYVTDSVYYFLIFFLPNLSRETYLGLITLCVFYLFIVNAFKLLSSRGMTFPLLSQMRRNNFDDDRWIRMNGNRFEFSDDETFESDNEHSENEDNVSDDNIEDDDDEDEEEGVEFDVTDDDSDSDEADRSSSDESDATSTTNLSEIDIQLPPANNTRYNLRRSLTPCRSKFNKPEDFEREIEKEREKQKCVVCQDNEKSVLILPCRHMCLCVQCGNHIARSRRVARRVCPLCRHRIRTIMNVYV